MKIFKDEFIILLEEKDSVREAFLSSARFGFVFPFIPLFKVDTEKFFKTSFFVDHMFDFPSAHYILGFTVISSDGNRIKYGGKVHITNTGLDITPLFFGVERKRLCTGGTKTELLPYAESFKVETVFVRLIKSARVIFGYITRKSDVEALLRLKTHPKFIFKTHHSDPFFLIPVRYISESEEVLKEFISESGFGSEKHDFSGCQLRVFTLPQDIDILLENLVELDIEAYPQKCFEISSIFELMKLNRNLILVIGRNYLIPLDVRT